MHVFTSLRAADLFALERNFPFTAVYATTAGVRLVGCTLSVPGVFLCLFWVLCSCSISSLCAPEAAPLLVLALKPGLAAGGAYAPLCFT